MKKSMSSMLPDKPKCKYNLPSPFIDSIILDVDGVLSDLTGHIIKSLGIDRKVEQGVKWEYDLCTELNVPYSALQDVTFNQEFWDTLPKTELCDPLLEMLGPYFEANRVCICSAFFEDSDITVVGKKNWILENIGKVPFLLGKQKHFLAHSKSLMIDDYEVNTQMFAGEGGQTILVPSPWNSKYDVTDPIQYIEDELRKFKVVT